LADGGLPAFGKKTGPVKELCAVGFLHFMMMFYIFCFYLTTWETERLTLLVDEKLTRWT
jgi:hypothetical protein